MQPVIVLPSLACAYDQSTVHTQLTPRRLLVLHMCAMFEGLTEFCLVFRFGFRASLLDFTSQIQWLHNAQMYEEF